MVAKKSRNDIWVLGSAGTYRDRPGQGCFSQPDLTSICSFGWDKKAQGFVVEHNHFGIAGITHRRLLMPVELAEVFLTACLYEDFRNTFLLETYPKEPEEEVLRACGYILQVSRDKARPGPPGSGRWYLPGLYLSCTDLEGKKSGLSLFSDFRINFGARMKRMSAVEVRKQLGTG